MVFEEKKIKLESLDDYESEANDMNPLRDHDYCKNPKLEELIEPKVEEPDYFEMDRPSELTPESPIFEYPDYLKLEFIDDYGSEAAEPTQAQTTKSKDPGNGKNIRMPKLFKEIGEPKQTINQQNTRKCSVCSLIMNIKNFITTKSKNRKFIVILGAVLSGKMSIPMAKESLYTVTMYTCPSHLPEGITEIFNILNISHVNQMYLCSIDKKAALMTTVQLMSSTFTFIQLYDALFDYFRKDGPEPPRLNRNETDTLLSKRTTPAPGLKPYDQSPTSITSSNRRLILMVGDVLSGRKTVKEAQSLISKFNMYIPAIHLSKAVEEIYRALNIQNIGRMQWCSTDNKKKLMSIVNSFSPQHNFAEFSRLLEDFVQNAVFL